MPLVWADVEDDIGIAATKQPVSCRLMAEDAWVFAGKQVWVPPSVNSNCCLPSEVALEDCQVSI